MNSMKLGSRMEEWDKGEPITYPGNGSRLFDCKELCAILAVNSTGISGGCAQCTIQDTSR